MESQETPDLPPSSTQSNASVASGIKRKKILTLRSPLWAEFDRIQDADGNWKARCKACGIELKADPQKNGTSGLKSHYGTCKERLSLQEDSSQTILGFKPGGDPFAQGSLSSIRCDLETVRNALIQLVISAELPFKFVARQEFKYFMSIVCPKFIVPSRWTVQRAVYNTFSSEKLKLKDYFQRSGQRVCLTTDTWTSCQRVNYMCLTGHYIDEEWVLQKKILSFCPITSHKGKDIGIAINKCLLDWGLDKIFTLTMDNASSNDKAVEFLVEKYKGKENSIMDCKMLHMRCAAHIVNLVVKDGLKTINSSVLKVRAVVSYIRASPSRLIKFKECAKAEKIDFDGSLVLDVPTRWNSTYLMLDTALKFRYAFERYEDENPSLRCDLETDDSSCMVPEPYDWKKVEEHAKHLKLFYEFTLKVSGSKFTTSNFFFNELANIDEILREWQEQEMDYDLVTMATEMRVKFHKYWGDPKKINKLIFLAFVFDPRQKWEYVELCLSDIYGENAREIIADVKSTLINMFKVYKSKIGGDMNDGSDMDTIDKGKSSKSTTSESELRVLQRMERLKQKKDGGFRNEKSELDRYLAEEVDETEINAKYDVLAYWKINSARFPIVAQMARDILAVQVSTVASESAFSTGGRMLDSYRSSLGPKSVESLICTQDWLRGRYDSSQNEEDPMEQEKFEFAIAAGFSNMSLE